MPYPPPEHYLSDLALRPTLEATSSRVLFEVTRSLCGADGGVLLGVLATAIDMAAGGLSRRQAEPDWVATSDLAIDLAEPIPVGPCRVDCRLARRGRGLVLMELDLRAGHDEDAPRHGLASAAFAVLPNPGREQGSGPRGDGREPASGVPNDSSAARAHDSLADRLGIRNLDVETGAIEVDLDDYIRNTFGALQGGVVAVLGEAAIQTATGRPLVALAVRYRSLGRVGPFRTDVERVSGAHGDVARATLRDQGAGGAVIAVATGRLSNDPGGRIR